MAEKKIDELISEIKKELIDEGYIPSILTRG